MKIWCVALSLAVAAVLGLAAPRVRGQAVANDDTARLAADEVQRLVRQLTAADIDQDARDAIARRLFDFDSTQTRAALLSALTDPATPPARLSVARAIADLSQPDPTFIDPLFVLLDPGIPRQLLDATADALASYKDKPDVATRLLAATAPQRDPTVRTAAVRALSRLTEKRVARRLVELTADPEPAIASAAVVGLQDFTGLPRTSTDDWREWWTRSQPQDDQTFRDRTLNDRARRFDSTRRQRDEAEIELRRRLLDAYRRAEAVDKPQTLMSYLTSPRAAVRLAGADLALDLARTNDLPPGPAQQLRTLLSDWSADVRIRAAMTLGTIGDTAALEPLLRQLSIESVPPVREALTESLGSLEDVAAVPTLARLLEDPAPSVRLAAMRGLSSLAGRIVETDPPIARSLAERFAAVVRTRGDPAVRAAAVEVLATLRQPEQAPLLRELVTAVPPEPLSVRQPAIRGLGLLRDSRASDILVDTLADPVAAVRLEAVRALALTSRDFIHAESLLRVCNPQVERDASVRDEAWQTLVKLFPLASAEQLSAWVDRPELADKPNHQLEILKTLLAKARTAGRLEDQYGRLRQIGDLQARLRNYPDAAGSYTEGLRLARESGAAAVWVIGFSEALLQAQLSAREFDSAVSFARQLIGEDPANHSIVGPALRKEAERLRDANRLDDAERLITASLAMSPPLAAQYLSQLHDLQRQVRDRLRETNDLPLPGQNKAVAEGR